jgi:hypothetical protein
MSTEIQPSLRDGWLTNDQYAAIVLLTMGLGLVASFTLAFKFDLWLAPPFVEYTPWLHVALASVWLPVLIGCALVWQTNWRARLGLLLGGILLTVLYLLFIMAPYLVQPVTTKSSQCQQTLLPNNEICYTCHYQELKGSVGSILVRPVRYPEVCQPGS